MKKKFRIILFIVLVTIMVTSILYLIDYYRKTNNDNEIFKSLEQVGTNKNELESSSFEDDSELLNNVENNQIDNSSSNRQNSTLRLKANSYSNFDLKSLKIKNGDAEGWIKIDGTRINYSVMQNGDFYLHNNFYKKYSISGTPYLASYCNIISSDNLIIYGHHMSSGSMFAGLDIYKTYKGYKNHKYIRFYTLSGNTTIENKYEVIGAYKVQPNTEVANILYGTTKFKDEEDFNEYKNTLKASSLYDTGANLSYGDKFITLSTCEYSQKNGRLVVVGKLIE